MASVSTEKQLQDEKHANVFDDTQPRREDEVTREDEKESSEYYLFQCRKDYRDSDVAQPSPADVATATESFVSSESLVLSLESTAAADRRQLFTPPSIVQPPTTGETTTASNQKKHAKDFALFSNGKDSEKSMKNVYTGSSKSTAVVRRLTRMKPHDPTKGKASKRKRNATAPPSSLEASDESLPKRNRESKPSQVPQKSMERVSTHSHEKKARSVDSDNPRPCRDRKPDQFVNMAGLGGNHTTNAGNDLATDIQSGGELTTTKTRAVVKAKATRVAQANDAQRIVFVFSSKWVIVTGARDTQAVQAMQRGMQRFVALFAQLHGLQKVLAEFHAYNEKYMQVRPFGDFGSVRRLESLCDDRIYCYSENDDGVTVVPGEMQLHKKPNFNLLTITRAKLLGCSPFSDLKLLSAEVLRANHLSEDLLVVGVNGSSGGWDYYIGDIICRQGRNGRDVVPMTWEDLARECIRLGKDKRLIFFGILRLSDVFSFMQFVDDRIMSGCDEFTIQRVCPF